MSAAVIDAPIEDVWAIARDFTGHWHSSMICNSSIEDGLPSDRVGCVRAFELSDGGKLRELLVGLSDERHEFSYRILESPLPVEDYVASVRFIAGHHDRGDVRRVGRRLPRAAGEGAVDGRHRPRRVRERLRRHRQRCSKS